MNYVLDGKGNRINGLSKEEVLSIIQQAIDKGDLSEIDKDSAFVSKLKCCVSGGTFSIAFTTQAKYNELKANNQLVVNCIYFITDDETEANIEASIESLNTDMGDVKKRLDALGFKQGSVVLADGITATQNELKRQGNYVLGSLTITMQNLATMGRMVVGTIPSEFRPQIDTEIAFLKGWTRTYSNVSGSMTTIATCTILATTGEIVLRAGAIDSNTSGGMSTTWTQPFEIKFGYEAKPLIADEE